jgi:hypothetical protein
MEMEIAIKEWKVVERDGVLNLTGKYAAMVGNKEIAVQSFNDEYGGAKINFTGDLLLQVGSLTDEIKTSIKDSF